MLKYTGELYAKIGRKYIPTGKTGAQWDEMEARIKRAEHFTLPKIGSVVEFEWDKEKRIGVVTTYAQCASGHFEVTCDDHEVFVLRSDMVRILPNTEMSHGHSAKND